VTRWPLWRVLAWIEAWLVLVAAFHHSRPIHEDVIVPLLFGIVPAIAFVACWGLARAAVGHHADPEQRATWLEVAIATLAEAGAVVWIGQWALEARDNLRRMNEMIGQATIIIDVSLTGLSAAACIAALSLDWILSTAHEPLRAAMAWLRRAHLVVTAAYVLALFGSTWLFMHWPDASGADTDALFSRARIALYVYEYARATVFPVQAFFAAMAVLIVTADSRQANKIG
jgi:hypothetical protein